MPCTSKLRIFLVGSFLLAINNIWKFFNSFFSLMWLNVVMTWLILKKNLSVKRFYLVWIPISFGALGYRAPKSLTEAQPRWYCIRLARLRSYFCFYDSKLCFRIWYLYFCLPHCVFLVDDLVFYFLIMITLFSSLQSAELCEPCIWIIATAIFPIYLPRAK